MTNLRKCATCEAPTTAVRYCHVCAQDEKKPPRFQPTRLHPDVVAAVIELTDALLHAFPAVMVDAHFPETQLRVNRARIALDLAILTTKKGT